MCQILWEFEKFISKTVLYISLHSSVIRGNKLHLIIEIINIVFANFTYFVYKMYMDSHYQINQIGLQKTIHISFSSFSFRLG